MRMTKADNTHLIVSVVLEEKAPLMCFKKRTGAPRLDLLVVKRVRIKTLCRCPGTDGRASAAGKASWESRSKNFAVEGPCEAFVLSPKSNLFVFFYFYFTRRKERREGGFVNERNSW